VPALVWFYGFDLTNFRTASRLVHIFSSVNKSDGLFFYDGYILVMKEPNKNVSAIYGQAANETSETIETARLLIRASGQRTLAQFTGFAHDPEVIKYLSWAGA